jgi:hypothetical protein
MKDFFISYTSADKEWAEWIAFVLEEQGFNTIIQAWDFRAGSNFVLEMQKAATDAARTVIILSPDYLRSGPGASEWAAAFNQDPTGENRKLVPVMIKECKPSGLLASIVQIRLNGLSESEAHKKLVDEIYSTRAKPIARPKFPGFAPTVIQKPFPASNEQHHVSRPTVRNVLPPLKVSMTDADKRKFVKSGFDAIRSLFEQNLALAKKQDSRVDTEFDPTTNKDFQCELYVDGSSTCECRIWQGCMGSDSNICYSNSADTFRDSCNEIISLNSKGEPFFKAMMKFHDAPKNIDCNCMTAEEVAELLWLRFTAPLKEK